MRRKADTSPAVRSSLPERMAQVMDAEIRQRMDNYLHDVSDLAAFHNWIVPAVWDVQPSDLASRILFLLSEYLNGHWSEAELKTRFREL